MLTIDLASENMIVAKRIVMQGRDGLSLYLSKKIVEAVYRFKSEVKLISLESTADAKDIFGILGLALAAGEPLIIKTEGEDAQSAFNAVWAILKQTEQEK